MSIWDHIDPYPPDSLCWEWQGAINHRGYGNYKGRAAHREVYKAIVGPIDDSLVLDHLCRNRSCVKPDHMEVVTRAENTRRGHGNGKKSACPEGHKYGGSNLIKRNGRRFCKACQDIHNAR